MKIVLSDSEHGMCARHIWAQCLKKLRGEERHRQFWRYAKSSFEVKFKDELENLSQLGNGIVEDILEYNKKTGCRAYFRKNVKCDSLDNNMCESYCKTYCRERLVLVQLILW